MANQTSATTRTTYNQKVIADKKGKESSTHTEQRSLTREASGTKNGTSKAIGRDIGKETRTSEEKATSNGTDSKTGLSTSKRESTSTRDLSSTSTVSAQNSQKVNVGLRISFSVPIHGKFPTSSNPQSSSC